MSHSHHVLPSEVEAWAVRYPGQSVKQIADAFNRNVNTVRRHLQRAGHMPPPIERREITNREVDEWAERYLAGDSLKTLSLVSGRTEHTIRRHLIRRGVTMRPPGPKPDPKMEKAIRLHGEGVRIRCIAERLGVSVAKVSHWVWVSRSARDLWGGPQ